MSRTIFNWLNKLGKSATILTLSALFISFSANAEAEKAEASAEQPAFTMFEPSLEHQRDPNQFCAKCHKFEGQQFHGIHLTKTNPNNGKPINCVNCHGKISENHRRGVKDVMRFHGDIFDNKPSMYTVEEQNQVCFSCHKPEKLREKFWAHDVHAMKLPCASCHTLHPKKDAMEDIQPKQRVKLCVDCHGKQQALKEQAEAEKATSEQKDQR